MVGWTVGVIRIYGDRVDGGQSGCKMSNYWVRLHEQLGHMYVLSTQSKAFFGDNTQYGAVDNVQR
jgi:hypothetical protein